MEVAKPNFRSEVFQDILSDIQNESCVLIVGPDLVDYGESSCFETLCDELQRDNQYNQLIDLNPQYVFVHEELLQLKPTAKETTVLRYFERFYQRQSQYDEPLKKIAQIPFHLIVSFLPDTRLKRIFEEQHLRFQYSHYPREENPKPVEKPTKETPLIYNILGDFSEGDVIITFDHLFQYLSGIMGKRELPQLMQEAFKKARTFLFLGVHFERWYVQLILRIITTKDKKEKYTILKNAGGSEVYTLIARRLELDFIPTEPIEFLNQLYEECGRNKLLKTPVKVVAAKVFISYSHADKQTALQIEDHLKKNSIEVIRDDDAMDGGQKIDEFISTINDVDCVLAIVSQNSLHSAWVSKEIITTIQKANKHFLPCYLDESFLDKDFMDGAERVVDEKIAAINTKIVQRGRGNTDDLFNERKDWTEYIGNLPVILDELNRRKCISLQKGDLEKNLPQLVDNIIKHKSQ
jgi:hypothetical protein